MIRLKRHNIPGLRELGEDITNAKLMSQYFCFQEEVNFYIDQEYRNDRDVKPLQTPHDLYRIRKIDDPNLELTLDPNDIECFFSPNSKYVAISGQGKFEVFELDAFNEMSESDLISKVQNVVLQPEEKAIFTPDSSMIIIYSCLSFKVIDIDSNELIHHQILSPLITSHIDQLQINLYDADFNRYLCFGQYFWQVNASDNYTNFIFFSPLFIYSFEVRGKEAMKVKPPAVALYIMNSASGRVMPGSAVSDNLRYCGGGGNTVYALERAADDSVIIWKGAYQLYEGQVQNELKMDQSNVMIGKASIHFESLPASFSSYFDEIPLSSITRESNLGIEVKDGSKSKVFYDSKTHQVSCITYGTTGCDLQKIFYIDSDPRLITSFDNTKIFALVGHDSYLSIWIVEEKKIINVLRTFVERCVGVYVTPNNRNLILVSQTNVPGKLWKVDVVPIEFQFHSLAEQLCFDYNRKYNLVTFLCFKDDWIQFVEDDHKLIRRHFDHRDDIFVDLLEHPLYNPNVSSKRFIVETPTADLEKRFSVVIVKKELHHQGLIVHYRVEDRDEGISGVLVQAYLHESLKRFVLLDTLGIDSKFVNYAQFSVNYNLTAAFIYFEHSIYCKLLGDFESPFSLLAQAQIVQKRGPASNFIKHIDFLNAFSTKVKTAGSTMGTFFEVLNKEYVDCSTVKGKTHLAISNLSRELKSESYFEEQVSIKALCKSEYDHLYCLYGDEGLVMVDRQKETYFWYKTPSRVKKMNLRSPRIDKVRFTPNNKFLVVSVRSETVRYFVSVLVEGMVFLEMFVDVEVPDWADTYWAFTESSFYWIYANGFSKKIEIINIELNKSVCMIPMKNVMDIKNLRIVDGKLMIVGLLKEPEAKDHEFVPHTVFRFVIPLRPELNSLLPLIQHQMIKYFTTDYSEIKDMCAANINSLLKASNHHVVKMNSIFSIIMFMLNNRKAFRSFALTYQPIEVMLENHKLIRLFFKANKPESNALVVELIDAYIHQYREYPFLDEDFIQEQITSGNSKSFMRNPASQLMMRRLLFSPVGETPPITLKNSWRGMKKLRPDQEDNIKSNVVIDTYEKLASDEARNPKIYNCFETKIRLDLTNGSRFSIAFFEMMHKCSDNDLVERYKVIIYYKWAKIFWFVLLYSIIYWAMTVLYYIYFGFPNTFGYWGVLLIGLTLSFLIFEIKCASANFRKYFRDFWNIFDLTILSTGMLVTAIILERSDADYGENNLALNWFKAIVVFGLCARSLTLLKVFSMTRYLISMILRVFANLIPFVIVVVCLILTYAYLWMITPKLSREMGGHVSFYSSIQAPINIIFGNSDPLVEDLGVVMFFTLMVGNLVFALTMVNFLIAIITATFDNVSNKRDIHDVDELLGLIRDFDAFFHGFKSVTSEANYYLTLIEKPEKEDQNHAMLELQLDLRKEVASLEDIVERKLEAIEEAVAAQNQLLKEVCQAVRPHARNASRQPSTDTYVKQDSNGAFEAMATESSPERVPDSEDEGGNKHHELPKNPIGLRQLHRRLV